MKSTNNMTQNIFYLKRGYFYFFCFRFNLWFALKSEYANYTYIKRLDWITEYDYTNR